MKNCSLLPLDCPRRFRSDIVDYSVHALDFIDDSRRNTAKKIMLEWEIVCGHSIRRGDGPEGQDVFVCALVAHDADRVDRQQDRECLPDLIIEPAIS